MGNIHSATINDSDAKSDDTTAIAFAEVSSQLDENGQLTLPLPPPAAIDGAIRLVIDQQNRSDTETPEEKQANNNQFCQKFFKVVELCAKASETPMAEIYNASMGAPTVFNTIFSTLPETMSSSVRESSAVYAAFALLFVMSTAHVLKDKFKGRTTKIIENIRQNSAYLSNGLNFTFGMGCAIAATTWKTTEPNNMEVDGVLAGLLGISLGVGLADCYGKMQPDSSLFRRATDKVTFPIRAGILMKVLERLYDFAPGVESKPSAGVQQFFDWAPYALAGLALISTFATQVTKTRLPQSLALVDNMLTDLGNGLVNYQMGNPLAIALIAVKPLVIAGSSCIIQYNLAKKSPEKTPLIEDAEPTHKPPSP